MCSLLIHQDHQPGDGTHNSPRPSAHGLGHGVINKHVEGFSKVTLSGAVVDVSPCELGGVSAPSFSRISHPATMQRLLLPGLGGHLAGVRPIGSTRPFIRVQRWGCRPVAAQSFRDKPKYQGAFSVTIHNRVLSNALVLAGPQPSEASNGRVPKPTRAFPEKKGELPNVGS